ncbi:MAG: heparinase II/III family protein [Parvularculaceae bacterium]
MSRQERERRGVLAAETGDGRRSARGVAQSVLHRVERAWGESPFYQARLSGPAPDRIAFHPTDPYAPDLAQARDVARGRFQFAAQTVDCLGEFERAFDLAGSAGAARDYLHRFSWLRPLAALGEDGRRPALRLAHAWLDRHERWSPEGWEPRATGERLIALCCHGALVAPPGDALWRSRLLTSMARQTRHLAQTGHRADAGYDRLSAALALSIAGLCLPGCDEAMERGFEQLRRELRLQMRPDGGHIARNPSRQLEIVARLNMALDGLSARGLSAPGFLTNVATRAREFLATMRLGDGGLAVLNGGYEDDRAAVETALGPASARDDDPREAALVARHSGYQRLDAGVACLIVDIGASTRADDVAGPDFQSAGSLSFSSGRRRIVVNCGSGARLAGDWADALRLADAHSGAWFDAVDPDAASAAERRAARSAGLNETRALHRRVEDEQGRLVEIERRDGGPEAGGGAHARRLFLAADGDDLRGEDRFTPGAAPIAWRVRFHLHPSLEARASADGRDVDLLAPDGEAWWFRANAVEAKLEKSVYAGLGGAPAACSQIALTGLARPDEGPSRVKWRFARVREG